MFPKINLKISMVVILEITKHSGLPEVVLVHPELECSVNFINTICAIFKEVKEFVREHSAVKLAATSRSSELSSSLHAPCPVVYNFFVFP